MSKKENNISNNSKLTYKHKLFCEKYLILNNSTRAYIETYGNDIKKETAKVNACKLLKRNDVQEYIQEIRENVYSENIDTIEQILIELKNIYKCKTKSKKLYKVGGELEEVEVEPTFSERLKAIELYCKLLGFTNIYDEDQYYIKGDKFNDGNQHEWIGF